MVVIDDRYRMSHNIIDEQETQPEKWYVVQIQCVWSDDYGR
jgi:hypothetical protein